MVQICSHNLYLHWREKNTDENMDNCPWHISSILSFLSRSPLSLSLSPSPAHSKCLTGSLRKASPLLFPWQLACIGIDDISRSPTYFALKMLSHWTSPVPFPSQKDDATLPTVEGRPKQEGGFPLDKHAIFILPICRHRWGWERTLFQKSTSDQSFK